MAKAVNNTRGSNKKGEKLPLPKKTARALELPARRLHAVVERMQSWQQSDAVKGVIEALGEALTRVKDSQKELDGLPDSYVPHPKGMKRNLEVGQLVAVREARREIYSDLIAVKELEKLTVKKVGGRQLICETEEGSQIIVPRGHVQLVSAAA